VIEYNGHDAFEFGAVGQVSTRSLSLGVIAITLGVIAITLGVIAITWLIR